VSERSEPLTPLQRGNRYTIWSPRMDDYSPLKRTYRRWWGKVGRVEDI
jgi:hypothetical protein